MARQIIVKAGLTNEGRGKAPLAYQNPYWILLTFPYLTNDTFDRGRLSSSPQSGFRVVSRDEDNNDSRKTAVILFDGEVKTWGVTQTKSNHIHSFQAQLHNVDGTLALLEWMNAGDWCMFWSFRDRATYEKVRRRLIKQHGAITWNRSSDPDEDTDDSGSDVTGWQDGLKFVGRLQAPRHHEFRSADGSYDVGYSLTAYGFTELESLIYYDDLIRFKYRDAVTFFTDVGITLDQFLQGSDSDHPGFVNTNVTIPALTQVLLGKGAGVLSKDKGDTQMRPTSERASVQDSPNVQFEVPEAVSKILCGPDRDPPQYYSDLLSQIIGDQTYGGSPDEKSPDFLLPEVDDDNATQAIFYTKNPIQDYFPPNPLDFKNQTVWSILKNYVNEPINEIYTTIKPHPMHGGLVPTLVCRRSPYSSDTYQSSNDALKALPFSEVPRWVIPTALIMGYDIGRTDAARINYVHVTPSTMPSENPERNETLMRFQAPPVVNKVDVMKHGLRTYIVRVAGFANPTAESNDKNASERYTAFMADILLDAHLRYNGTLTCMGLQEPISVGDNITFNNILFHIEGVIHSGGIAADGSKTFTTQLQVSHGIPLKVVEAERDNAKSSQQPDNAVSKSQDSAARAQEKNDAAKAEQDELERLEEDIDKYKEPQEDKIRKLRNERSELDGVGLIGAKVHAERK